MCKSRCRRHVCKGTAQGRASGTSEINTSLCCGRSLTCELSWPPESLSSVGSNHQSPPATRNSEQSYNHFATFYLTAATANSLPVYCPSATLRLRNRGYHFFSPPFDRQGGLSARSQPAGEVFSSAIEPVSLLRPASWARFDQVCQCHTNPEHYQHRSLCPESTGQSDRR